MLKLEIRRVEVDPTHPNGEADYALTVPARIHVPSTYALTGATRTGERVTIERFPTYDRALTAQHEEVERYAYTVRRLAIIARTISMPMMMAFQPDQHTINMLAAAWNLKAMAWRTTNVYPMRGETVDDDLLAALRQYWSDGFRIPKELQ